jgi:hypothetical protein
MFLFTTFIMAEEKPKVLSLIIAFLSAINAILLSYHIPFTMTGATGFSYLFLFSLNSEQAVLFFRISILISLVSFTTFAYLSYYPRD